LIRSVNRRLGKRPVAGQTWVRLRPPNDEELVDEKINPKFVRFHRIGSTVKIVSALQDFIELQCGGETTMVGIPEFYDTWVLLVTEENWG